MRSTLSGAVTLGAHLCDLLGLNPADVEHISVYCNHEGATVTATILVPGPQLERTTQQYRVAATDEPFCPACTHCNDPQPGDEVGT